MPYLRENSIFLTVISFVFLTLMCSTAVAETNWVQRFLDRYHVPQAPAATGPSVPGSLGAVVQNGAISLTTEDIVRSAAKRTSG